MHRFESTRAGSIYALVDPREPDHIRYVGLTVAAIEDRRDSHVKQALSNRDDWHKSQWIRKLARENVTPSVKLLATGEWTVDEMCALEIENIAKFKATGHQLTNMTSGGESTLGLPAERRPYGDRSGQRRYPLSTKAHNNGRSKLTYEDGSKIVALYQSGIKAKDLAETYGVSVQTIMNVVHDKTPWTKPPVDTYVPIERGSASKEETNRKRSESLKRSWSDIDVRARRIEGMKRAWSDPNLRAQQSAQQKLNWRNQYS